MTSRVQKLYKKNLIQPPEWVATQCQYETLMGSVAYGTSNVESDIDLYGFCIPKKDIVFPHLAGEIMGFGSQIQRFNQYQQHHIKDKEEGKEYDISIYNIVRYFQLCMENNPNMIDSLFTPNFCVLHETKIGQMVRQKRKMFLHKGSFWKYKGYAYSQLHKMKNKNPEGKRKKRVEEQGFDTKFAYHTCRLLDEAEQILQDGDINIQRNREQLKAIRRGDMSEDDIIKWANDKEIELEKLYHTSKIQHKPDEAKIKNLLLECLEEHFGSLEKSIVREDAAKFALQEIADVLQRNRSVLE